MPKMLFWNSACPSKEMLQSCQGLHKVRPQRPQHFYKSISAGGIVKNVYIVIITCIVTCMHKTLHIYIYIHMYTCVCVCVFVGVHLWLYIYNMLVCAYVFEDSEDSAQNEVHVVHASSLAWRLDPWRNTTISDAPTEIWIKEGLQGLELQYFDVFCCSFRDFIHVIFMLFALSAAKSIRVQQPALFSSCNHGAGAALLVS